MASYDIPQEFRSWYHQQEVFDLHLETSIPFRLYGYDLHRDHKASRFFGYLYEHVDVPRAIQGGLTGAMWSIATNFFQPAAQRFGVLQANVAALAQELQREGTVRVVTTHTEYRAARENQLHAALLAVQGGNAFDGLADNDLQLDKARLLTRVTLVHMTNSSLGQTSSPFRHISWRQPPGLTARGKRFVDFLNHERCYVDVSHISDAGFDAVWDVHDKTQPLLSTHSASRTLTNMWRNITDAQVKKIADTGGVVGVIVHRDYLSTHPTRVTIDTVADHVEALMQAGGEDVIAIGTDLDGDIVPPKGMRNAKHAYMNLAWCLHRRGWSRERLQKFLAGNFLRTFKELRP